MTMCACGMDARVAHNCSAEHYSRVPAKGWLERQIKQAAEDVRELPEWLRPQGEKMNAQDFVDMMTAVEELRTLIIGDRRILGGGISNKVYPQFLKSVRDDKICADALTRLFEAHDGIRKGEL